MVRLTGEGLIECEECSNEIKIYSENFEYSSASSERGMGPEVQHSFYDEITCEQCGNKISFLLLGVEYTMGSNNHESNEIKGANLKENDFELEIGPEDYSQNY